MASLYLNLEHCWFSTWRRAYIFYQFAHKNNLKADDLLSKKQLSVKPWYYHQKAVSGVALTHAAVNFWLFLVGIHFSETSLYVEHGVILALFLCLLFKIHRFDLKAEKETNK